ncbi:SDR family oxidoreductase [Arthrobacter sp. NPDC090010]|uniref:SDR family oxidoreductase n=1 Tax=Arthrobacter sp. NPDC090010 TaxID=3363942 RepID=UPI00382119AA
MSYLVHGASGAQGSPVVSGLLAAHREVTALGREASQPAPINHLAVDYGDVDSLAAAYQGAEGLFIHLPLGAPDVIAGYAANITEAVVRARPARIVVSTSGQIIDAPGHPLQQPADSPLPRLIAALSEAELSAAVTAPRLFLENLLLPPVIDGVMSDGVLRYPVREDYRVSWASHLDVADAAVALLLDPHVTGVVGIGAPTGTTGPELAAAFAAHLGKDVRFEQITPAEFGAMITPLFGAAATAGVVALYEAQWTLPDSLINADTSETAQLGIAARSAEEWLRDIAL